MFRRKKKEEEISTPPNAEAAITPEAPPAAKVPSPDEAVAAEPAIVAADSTADASAGETAAPAAVSSTRRGNRVQKVGIISSDKMQKTVVVRVDRLVLHRRYRRYVRRTTKFHAHDELGSGIGDRVRIVETRPLSAQKRWRVVEILQKAAK
ncbi:MAG: 30S ribosomal protein S17 [Acidobacteria bacterium]|nr:MAG: 30S ribosomal protein S17 [Acidobacteriota bacterium]